MASRNFVKRKDCEECGYDRYTPGVGYEPDEPEGKRYPRIWTCESCAKETPRAKRVRRKNQMTPTQKRLVEQIKEAAIRPNFDFQKELIWAKWEVTLMDHGQVSVYGYTSPSLDNNGLCDTYYHFFIGPRGSLEGSIRPTLCDEQKVKSRRDFYKIRQ